MFLYKNIDLFNEKHRTFLPKTSNFSGKNIDVFASKDRCFSSIPHPAILASAVAPPPKGVSLEGASEYNSQIYTQQIVPQATLAPPLRGRPPLPIPCAALINEGKLEVCSSRQAKGRSCQILALGLGIAIVSKKSPLSTSLIVRFILAIYTPSLGI